MVGTDRNGAGINDWQLHAPSSTTFSSDSLSEEFRSNSLMDFSADNGNVWSLWTSEVQNSSVSTRIEEKSVAGIGINFSDVSMQPNSFGYPGLSRHGGFAESLPARQEFNMAKLDTAPIPPASMASSSYMNSQCSRNPPLLDPTTLMDLESPVFLYKSMTSLSPITGEFQGPGNIASSPKFVSPLAAPIKSKDNILEELLEAVACKPPMESHSRLSGAESKAASIEANNYYLQSPHDFQRQSYYCFSSEKVDTSFNDRVADSPTRNNQSPGADDQQLIESDPRGELSTAVGTPAEDGYSWRKYGQKQVKGSINPRSYYKCTHANCQAKKKVERSLEGDITEIVYMGDHNHPIPYQNSRSTPLLHQLSDPPIDGSEQPNLQAFLDGNTVKRITQNMSGSSDWSGDYPEGTSSLPVAAEYGDASKTLQHNLVGTCLSSDAIPYDVEEDDRPIHQSISPGCDGEGDEPESKISKISAYASEMSAASRAHREPKLAVQAISEADILEDGYRWRKYGQKIVKGNPNPRSYYKCTSPGCKVRKHIERVSNDLKSVLTTYEGKHNHDVPAARSSIHPNSTTISTTNARQSNSHLQRPETTQDSFVMFDGPANLRTFGFPGREHLGLTAPSLPFAMRQMNSMNHSMVGLGPMTPREMPVVPPLHSYLRRLHPNKEGLMMPTVESKEEHLPLSQLHMAHANSAYGQFMNRLH